ncbi:hypothetical protein [Segetibacter sp.]|jgi:septal ring factor EnvC (AmiA/AmiB activator)|uniref:hypothetical protein n=1 Tax=Segetibacter sp. TaxID=2231182 RepID=UPI002631B8AE|nr:hypothetical protein [Segetibacter sp.]MCW3081793.1 hypothetical protein [Segetibacter sp.]
MRKLLLLGMLAVYCHVSNAQSASDKVTSVADTTPVLNNIASSDTRLNKLEKDMESLKKENEILKKQMKQVSPASPNTKRKLTVSRVGSKQVIVE